MMLLVELVLFALLAVFLGPSSGFVALALCVAATAMVGLAIGFVGLISGYEVREVVIAGSFLHCDDGRRNWIIDLGDVSNLRILRLPLGVPILEIHQRTPRLRYGIPLVGHVGQEILSYVLQHVPASVRLPYGVRNAGLENRRGFFRPREESLSLPEVR